MSHQFDILKDRDIKSITYDNNYLIFNCVNGEQVAFHAVGDCCSQSFIESVDDPDVFKNSVFTSVEVVSGGMEEKDCDVHKWTFYKFKTDKGMCTLSFRNESNGYYDGGLELVRRKR